MSCLLLALMWQWKYREWGYLNFWAMAKMYKNRTFWKMYFSLGWFNKPIIHISIYLFIFMYSNFLVSENQLQTENMFRRQQTVWFTVESLWFILGSLSEDHLYPPWCSLAVESYIKTVWTRTLKFMAGINPTLAGSWTECPIDHFHIRVSVTQNKSIFILMILPPFFSNSQMGEIRF